MLLPAAAMTVGSSWSKRTNDTLELSDLSGFELIGSESKNGEDEFEDDRGSNALSNGEEDDCEDDCGLNSPSNVLLEIWNTLRPPVKEKTIKESGMVSCKKSQALYSAKILRQFLADENGPVNCIEMRCLKPNKVGSGKLLDNTPLHLPDIASPFMISSMVL